MGALVTQALQPKCAVWFAHRQELVLQASRQLKEVWGAENVGMVLSGYPQNPHARIQVASVGTVLSGDVQFDKVDLVVLDECHHYAADVWQALPLAYQRARRLGLTATPERSDGRPLDHLFDQLIVGAQYSELLKLGHLVPWTVYRPKKHLGHDLAIDPVIAYSKLRGGPHRGFGFYFRREEGEEDAQRFREAGIRAEFVDCNTDKDDRRNTVARLRGDPATGSPVDLILNLYTMTEGVDIPRADLILLARNIQFTGAYKQICGRAGRPAPGKKSAILVDLVGSSLVHGNPVTDCDYSLSGRPIRPKEATIDPASVPAAHADREKPLIAGDPLELDFQASTFLPDPKDIPAEFLPQQHAERLRTYLKKSHRRGYGIQRALASIIGGLGE